MQYEKATVCLHEATQELGNAPYSMDIRNTLGRAYASLGLWEKAVEEFDSCLIALQSTTLYASRISDIAACFNNIAVSRCALGDYPGALEVHKYCLMIRQNPANNIPTLDVVLSYCNLGNVYYCQQNYVDAIKYCVIGRQEYHKTYGNKPHIIFATVLNNIGTSHYRNKDYGAAIEWLTKAVTIYQSIYHGEPHKNIADIFNNLGSAYYNTAFYDEAIIHFYHALEIREIIYNHAASLDSVLDFTTTLNNLGLVFYNKGEHSRTIDLYTQCVKVIKEACAKQPILYQSTLKLKAALVLGSLGDTYSHHKDYAKAIEHFSDGLKMRQEVYGTTPHPDIANSLIKLGRANFDNKEYNKTIAFYCRAMEIMLYYPEDSCFDYVLRCVAQISHHYSLNPQNLGKKIVFYTEQKLKFADTTTHLIAASRIKNDDLTQQQDKILELRLAWIFTPGDDRQTKTIILEQLSPLLGANVSSVELLLSIFDNNTERVRALIAYGTSVDIQCNGTTLIDLATTHLPEISELLRGTTAASKPVSVESTGQSFDTDDV